MSTISTTQLDDVLQRLRKLHESDPKIPLPSRLPSTAEEFSQQTIRIVVVGEIKKGKSSLLNALVGMDGLSPVSSDIATSVVYRLHYNPTEDCFVTFKEGAEEQKKRIPRNTVASYGTENENPGNQLNVNTISLGVPSPFLKKGFELLDTPGLGGLFATHADVTWTHIPQSHIVMFVIDSTESVISRHEIEYLEKIKALGKVVFFVQTKTDAADAEQVQAWKERNLSIISPVLGKKADQIPYFCVSTTMWHSGLLRGSDRHMQRSGVPALLGFLEGRLSVFRQVLRKHLIGEIDTALVPYFMTLKANAEAASASTDSQQQRLTENRLVQMRRDLAEWQTGRYREASRDFHQNFADLQRISTRNLRNALNGTAGNQTYDMFLQNIQHIPISSQTEAVGLKHLEQLTEIATSQAYTILSDFQNRSLELLATLANQLESSKLFTVPSPIEDQIDILKIQSDFSHNNRTKTTAEWFQDIATVSGTVALLSIAGVASGGVALLFGGVVAVAVGSSRSAMREQQESQQLRSKLVQAANVVLRNTTNSAIIILEDLAVSLRRAGEDTLEECISQRRREIIEQERAASEMKSQRLSSEQIQSIQAAYQTILGFRQHLTKLRNGTTGEA